MWQPSPSQRWVGWLSLIAVVWWYGTKDDRKPKKWKQRKTWILRIHVKNKAENCKNLEQKGCGFRGLKTRLLEDENQQKNTLKKKTCANKTTCSSGHQKGADAWSLSWEGSEMQPWRPKLQASVFFFAKFAEMQLSFFLMQPTQNQRGFETRCLQKPPDEPCLMKLHKVGRHVRHTLAYQHNNWEEKTFSICTKWSSLPKKNPKQIRSELILKHRMNYVGAKKQTRLLVRHENRVLLCSSDTKPPYLV